MGRVLLAIGLGVLAVIVAAAVIFGTGQGNGAPLWAIVIGLASGILLGKVSDKLFDFAFKKELALACEPLDNSARPWGSPAQFIGMAWNHMLIPGPPHQQVEIHALFGIVKVTARNAQAIGCRATTRVRFPIQTHDARAGGTKWVERWIDAGNLNWFSPSLRQGLTRLDSLEIMDLAGHLSNPVENLDDGESKYLQLCYVPNGWALPLICSDIPRQVVTSPAGADGYSKFLMEVTFSATDLKTSRFYFEVKTKADTVELARAPVPEVLENQLAGAQ